MQIGAGVDGTVLVSDQGRAVKFLNDRPRYARELEVYQVLRGLGITSVAGHAVPELIRFDDELLAIEMTIVRPPFVLDFAAAKTEFEYAWLGFDEDEVWAEHVSKRFPRIALKNSK